jgi:division/cell wall cluster transcriptional repressor MraZ
MIQFSGTSIAKLDRGRCFFPAQFRRELPDAAVAHLKVRVSEDDNRFLEIFEEKDWKERVEKFANFISLQDFDFEAEDMLAEFTASVESIEMDLKSETNPANVGRILIPKKLLEKVGIKNEVMFVGTSGRVLLWDKEAYENRPTKNMLATRMKERQAKNNY